MGIPAQETRGRRPRSPIRPGLPVARHRVGFTPGGPQGPSPAVLGQLPGWGQNLGTARHGQVTTAAPQLCQRLGLGVLVPAGAQLHVRRPCPEKRCVCELGRTRPPKRRGDSAKRRLCSVRTLLTHCSSLHGGRVRAFHLPCPLWHGFGVAGRPGRTSVYPASPHPREALYVIGSFC